MRQCEYCGADFEPKRASQRFCSRSCSGAATARLRGQNPKREWTCQHCGGRFWQYETNAHTYCSRKCAGLAGRTTRPSCEVCGKPVRLIRNRYCSKSCKSRAQDRPPIASWSGFYARAQAANPEPEPCAICGGPGNTDTIPTIAALRLWFGYVRDAMLHSIPTSATETMLVPWKYQPKATRKERNAGLKGMPKGAAGGAYGEFAERWLRRANKREHTHKPITIQPSSPSRSCAGCVAS